VWILPAEVAVTVEPSGAELVAEGLKVAAILADDPALPEMYEWEMRRDGLRTTLAVASYDYDANHKQMQVWAAFLGTEVTSEDTSHGRTRLSVTGVFEGVPVEVWTLVSTQAENEGAER
jgi:hypothetical protein